MMSNQGNVDSNFQYHTTGEENGSDAQIQPRRLELSLNTEDGSLLTAPLMSVLLAATDGFYSDLYSMIHGEIDVTTAVVPHNDDTAMTDQNEDENVTTNSVKVQTKKESMSKLSFAERRHELAWRLAANGKSLQHVAALCAAAASSQFSEATAISSRALQHTRTAWVQADEAQDAFFFFHAQLFPGRAAPHDVYGATDVVCAGHWYDLPRDLLLTVDRYDTSVESSWSKTEVDERWRLSVRDKLIMGEVGWMRRKALELILENVVHQNFNEVLWEVSIRGGIVSLTHGQPKEQAGQKKYPIEALLTVFPHKDPDFSEWTLLSIDINVQAKTGEFNHQLETSNRQRFDLHRLAALSMSREEARARTERSKEGDLVIGKPVDGGNEAADSQNLKKSQIQSPPARPLQSLFQVLHTFALSWQLELLSAQAQALRRGVWSAADGNQLQVTPVRFFDGNSKVLGMVDISFWKVDNSFGSPSICEVHLKDECIREILDTESRNSALNSKESVTGKSHAASSSQLTLSIRAELNYGIRVAISGGASILDEILNGDPDDSRYLQIRANVQNLLDSASSPFSLSASDALLAATKLCCELKCQAVVDALQNRPGRKGDKIGKCILPPWIFLSVDRGSIAVAARIRYHQGCQEAERRDEMPILFHVMCDARTGSFVGTFPRSMHVLRELVGNDVYLASEAMAVRISNLPESRKRVAGTGTHTSGRMVRDAFDSLLRSLNLLGQRAGVGKRWDNVDDKSSYLRDRSIQMACDDVKSSLMKCCGISALYGLVPLAISAATGLDAIPDM